MLSLSQQCKVIILFEMSKYVKLIRIPENPLYLLICHIIYSANRYCALNFSGDKLYPQKEHPSRELCREKSSHKLQLRIRGRLDFPRSQFVGSQMVLLVVNQLWLWSFPQNVEKLTKSILPLFIFGVYTIHPILYTV